MFELGEVDPGNKQVITSVLQDAAGLTLTVGGMLKEPGSSNYQASILQFGLTALTVLDEASFSPSFTGRIVSDI